MVYRVLMLGPSLCVRGGVSSVERLMLKHAPSEIRYFHLSTMKEGPNLLKCIRGAILWLMFPFILLWYRPTTVHIHFASRMSTWRKFPFAFMSRVFLSKVVLHAHGSEFKEFYQNSFFLARFLIRRFLSCGTVLLTLSERWDQWYSSIIPKRYTNIRILPNPIESTRSRAPQQQDECVIIFNGSFEHRKGPKTLITAVSLLSESVRSQIRVLMTGPGDHNALRRFTEEYDHRERIEILGWLSEADYLSVREEASIFVLPSFNEGLPMAMLEAMALGQVPITTPVGGIPDVIEDGTNGLLVEPGDASSVAAAIERLVTDENLRQSLSDGALATSREHDITDYMLRLSAIYSSPIM